MLNLKSLKIEYRKEPVGLDVKRPGFSWQLESNEQNVVQTAYRIVVRSEDRVAWDTGKQHSGQSIHVPYGGEPLMPQTIYEANVTVWDNYGNKADIKGGFEMGLLEHGNSRGKWITHTLEESEACPVFEKSFAAGKPVRRARVYASALGVYEVLLNGKKVGEDYFAPGWTNYRKRIQYQTYDVTKKLKEENVISMTVANGWYKGVFGFAGQSCHYGERVAAFAEIHLWYEDGTKEVIATDESWSCRTGSIRFSEIYDGETIDSTFEPSGPGPVLVMDMDCSRLVSQETEPIRITKRTKPVACIRTPKGEAVLDFGQNMSGIVEVKVNGRPGQIITVRHAEVLDREGNFYTENLRSAKATDTYICKGGGQTFLPHFTFHGFRYVAVEGMGEDLNPEHFTACTLHTDMEQTGSFACSHPLVNRLQQNIEWGQRSNFLDVPTDCPQRDERLGWTGDAQVFGKTAAFNFNTALFFRKWFRDLASEQSAEFGVPHIVPNILGNQDGAAAWGDCATILPWAVYEAYGDIRILEEQYESMKGWVEYIRSKETPNHLWQCNFQYADWLALDKEEGDSRTGMTDAYMVASAFYAYSVRLVRDAAEKLGYRDDFEEYDRLYRQIKASFNEEYITKTGRLVSETQTGCVLALYLELALEEHRPRILQSLVTNLGNHKNHLTTGFVGTPLLCHTLSENGRQDLAGILLLQEDYPSWLYAVKLGATTIWERWNSMKPDGSFDESGMNSFNHYAYGSIGDWMYRRLAGIRAAEPGYKRSILAPGFIKGITSAGASLETMYGRLSCHWSCINGRISVEVTVPANTTAILHLPERDTLLELGSGTWQYSYETETRLEMDKFSMESTLGQIMAEPTALELLEQYAPGMASNPMIKFALGQSINELVSRMPPGGEQLMRMVIDMLNKKE